MTKIYESPDKGKTVYEREFGEYDNRELVKSADELVRPDITPPPFHFFAANAYKWLTTDDQRDLPALIKMMESDKTVTYDLFYVPVHHSTPYKIDWYKPVVEGAVHLGTYKYSPY